MATSPFVYDVAIDAIRAVESAAGLRHLLHRSGLRCWGSRWSALPGALPADEIRFGVSASRATVRVIGQCDDRTLERELAAHDAVVRSPSVVVLAPRCPVGPRDLTSFGAAVVDCRGGLLHEQERLRDHVSSAVRDSAIADETDTAPPGIHGRVVASYDRIAEKFTARWANHPPQQALETFLSLLPRQATVLDAGCGPGHHAEVLARRGNQVTGIDVSEGMLRLARRRTRRLQFLQMDMQHLQFHDQSFDGIWCAAAALHVPREDIVSVLRGFRRVLRPTGVLGLNLQVGRASEIVSRDGDVRFFEYYRDGAEVARITARAGFEVVDSDYGETARNTHGLDLTLRWVTLYLKVRARD